MSSNRVLRVDELSEPQLRRLAGILQISHPDAVAYALALIDASDNHIDTAESEEKEEKSADVSKLQVDTQSTSSSDAVDPACLGETEAIAHGDFLISPTGFRSAPGTPLQAPGSSNAPGKPLQEGAADIFDPSDVVQAVTTQDNDDGFVEFTESPSQEGFEIPVIQEGWPGVVDPPTSMMAIQEVMGVPALSDVKECEETRSASEQDIPNANMMEDAEVEGDELKSPQKHAENNGTSEVQEKRGDKCTATNPMVVSEYREETEPMLSVETPDNQVKENADAVDVQATGDPAPDSNEIESPSKAEESGEVVDVFIVTSEHLRAAHSVYDHAMTETASLVESPSIPDLDANGRVVSMALSTNSESAPSVEAIVSGPSGKKGPPQPQRATPQAGAECDESLQPGEEETTAATTLPFDAQDLQVAASETVSKMPDSTETATHSSEEQDLLAAKIISDKLVHPSAAQTEQLEIEIALGATESDMTERPELAVDATPQDGHTAGIEDPPTSLMVVPEVMGVSASDAKEESRSAPEQDSPNANLVNDAGVEDDELKTKQLNAENDGLSEVQEIVGDKGAATNPMLVSESREEAETMLPVEMPDNQAKENTDAIDLHDAGDTAPASIEIDSPSKPEESGEAIDVPRVTLEDLRAAQSAVEVKTQQKNAENNGLSEAHEKGRDKGTATNPMLTNESREITEPMLSVETPHTQSKENTDAIDVQAARDIAPDSKEIGFLAKPEESSETFDVPTVISENLSTACSADDHAKAEAVSSVESPSIPDLDAVCQVVSMALSTTSESAPSVEVIVSEAKKQKKRPPSKKRPPKPQHGTSGAGESNVSLRPVEENTTGATIVPIDAQDSMMPAFTEATRSSERQDSPAAKIIRGELVHPSQAQPEQLEIEVTLGATESEMTESAELDVDTTQEAKKSTLDPPDTRGQVDSKPAQLVQTDLTAGDAVVMTAEGAEARPIGKKRPPSKIRSSDGDNDVHHIAPTSVDPPGYRNDNAQASGAAAHEVLAWQSGRADAQTEDTFGCFFDGYAATSRPDDDVPADASPEAGGYLVYDSEGGGKLVLQYSTTKIAQAVGFFIPGEGYSIQGFKFTRNHGRVELIGNCASGLAGRRNYYSGVCQYIRAAKDLNATLWMYPPTDGQGLYIDVYVYLKASLPVSSVLLPENQPCCVSEAEAVACLPKHADFFSNERVAPSKWIEMGNSIGVTIQLPEGKKPVPATEGLFIPGVSETPRREVSLPPWSPSSPQGSAAETGCYLVYDADGCRLIQHYSKTKVAEAVAFFAPGPGQKIPGFKFKSNQGRSSLIGNCSGGVEGRKRYYSGWCQFVRAAKAAQGALCLYPRNTLQGGLAVDIYVYTTKPKPGAHQTIKLQDNVHHDVNAIGAVACLPRHAEFFEGLTMDLTRWVEEGSKVGAASQV